LCACPAGAAIRPDQLVLVVNKDEPEGLRIARYYMEKRHVPQQNLIVVRTSRDEHIGREKYDREIAAPVRRYLQQHDPEGNRFVCLVLVYGLPLRVGSSALNPLEEKHVHELRRKLSNLKEKQRAGGEESPEQTKALKEDIARTENEMARVSRKNERASVDSEIALVMENTYPLQGWLPNRYFIGFRGRTMPGMPRKVLSVCRLDGPTEASVYRIIDDSMFAEDHGLAGKAYFDARWPDTGGRDLSAYQVFDRALHDTARMVERSRTLPVVLDERDALLGPGEAPDAALYCGWYSLGKYVDAFTWVRGAVGFHVASSECTTLRKSGSTVWCRKLLENGVAATLGPVAEPYLQSFPDPRVFFSGLLEGKTLIESYTTSNPFWSWQMVLIGDPLYRPFKTFSQSK